MDASDFDNDGERLITDPIGALNHLFLGGPPPERGTGCQVYENCDRGMGCTEDKKDAD